MKAAPPALGAHPRHGGHESRAGEQARVLEKVPLADVDHPVIEASKVGQASKHSKPQLRTSSPMDLALRFRIGIGRRADGELDLRMRTTLLCVRGVAVAVAALF